MIESEEHRENLLTIARKMIRQPQSCPVDENGEPTGTYLEYLSLMYNPEVAEIVKYLEPVPNLTSISRLAKSINADKEELMNKLEQASDYIISFGKQYAIPTPLQIFDIPFVSKKIYEGPNAKKFAELSRKFFVEEKYYKRWETSWRGTPYMRVLPISEEIEFGHEILPVENIDTVVDRYESFVQIMCPCRNRAEIEGIRECKDKYPIHNCLAVGRVAENMLKSGESDVKKLTNQEAKDLLKANAELGLVIATDNSAKISSLICSCCECCCGTLRGLTRFDNPRGMAKANFISSINEDLCVACGTCLERCKFGAITINDIAEVDIEKCMGCGLCAITCPSDAITLKRLERETIPGLTP